MIPQLFIHRVVPCATGHLWFPRVFLDEKNLPQSSHRNSQIFPCLETSCRSRSCCRENLSEQPSWHGNDGLAFGLCASIWTRNVYWLVNLRAQPSIRQGNRRLASAGSLSLWAGDCSRESDPSKAEGTSRYPTNVLGMWGDVEQDGGAE